PSQVLLVVIISTISVWCATDPSNGVPTIVKAHCTNATTVSTGMSRLEHFVKSEDSIDGKPTIKMSLERMNTTNSNKLTVQLYNGERASIMHDEATSPSLFDCSHGQVCAYTYMIPKSATWLFESHCRD
ncbi:hypothetical protein PMAYCL1PPCAC_00955, partial [Pristionchus mayeri]